MVGIWRGQRDPNVKDNTKSPADVTLNRIDLRIDNTGQFFLQDKSIPFDGHLDLTSKTQPLNIEHVLNGAISKMGGPSRPSYTLKWLGNDAIELQGADTDVVLHRLAKPASG